VTAKKSGKKSGGKLVRQEHGGAIRRGSKKGNTPGPGRPPSAIRATARMMFDERLPVLSDIAGNRKAKGSDRIRAIDVLGRIGLEQSISIADVRAALELTGAEIRGMLPPDQAEQLIARIRVHWMRL
jgi:hypothetical protein